jgi:hypothetical protein
MVLGGIILSAHHLETFNRFMGNWRLQNRMTAELKWNKVTNQKYAEYLSLVDFFFDAARKRVLRFKCVVLDTHQIDYRTYHYGDKELGFYKFFYQLLLHSFGRHVAPKGRRLIVHMDQRQSRYGLSDFRTILNRGMRKQYSLTEDLVRVVESINSRLSDVMQVADILMGAVGFQWNDLPQKPGMRQAKIDLANHVARSAGLNSLKCATPRHLDYFAIWPFRLTSKSKSAPHT